MACCWVTKLTNTEIEYKIQFLTDGLTFLGDSAYAAEPWLIPPYPDCPDASYTRFNKSHKSSRSFMERSIGLWKNCFRLADKSGGILLYKPLKVCRFIVATSVLHNIRRSLKLTEDEEYLENEQDMNDEDEYVNHTPQQLQAAGNQVRDNIRLNYFQ